MSGRELDWKLWLDRADEDLNALEGVLTRQQVSWGVAVWLAQQAVEKALKGMLVSRGVAPRRTHDLMELLDACVHLEPRMATLVEGCSMVAGFGPEIRYPDAGPLPGVESCREAALLATRLVAEIRGYLP